MVAPSDLGKLAADRLTSPVSDIGIQYIEGPGHYSFTDVAAAFAVKFGHPVDVETVPREQWEKTYKDLGFSPKAARAYSRMTAMTIDHLDQPSRPHRGRIGLADYVSSL